jgi:hypothetical protein
MMKPKGESVAEAIRDWMHEEIKKGPSYILDLGKFFFAVSSSTFGLFVTVEKLAPSTTVQRGLALSLGLLFLSVLVALRMAIPFTHKLVGAVDLYFLYEQHRKKLTYLSLLWFVLWVAGVATWLWRFL